MESGAAEASLLSILVAIAGPAGCLAALVHEARAPLRREFGRRAAALVLGVWGLVAAGFMARFVAVLRWPAQAGQPVGVDTLFNTVLVMALMVGGLALHLMLALLVILRLGGGVREVEVLGRTGGDEFVALMPHTDAEAAALPAQRLLQRLYAHPAGPQGAVVAASIGVASASDRRERRDDLLRRLDGALYAAKQGGGDRVVLAPQADAAIRLAAD